MTQVPLKHIAYHEAGHAVVALRLGYEVGKVRINPTYGSGSTQVRPRSPSPDDIRIDLAGPLAEALVNSAPFEEKIQLGSRGDWRNTRRSTRQFVALGFINGREGGILIELQETRAMVRRDKEAIARVAAALLEHVTLTGDDIKRIVEARS